MHLTKYQSSSSQTGRDRPVAAFKEVLFPDQGGQNFDGSSAVVYLPISNPDLGGNDVERFHQFSFYELGKAFAAITHLSGDVNAEAALWAIWGVQSLLKSLLEGKLIPISISVAKGNELLTAIDGIEAQYFMETDENGKSTYKFPDSDSPPIPNWRWRGVTRAVEEFQTVLREEMRETATYYVPRRGIFYTPALVDSADESFPKDLLPFIPEKARNDWKAAGRCLAFNLLSASGFHTVRAVEATLESYYQIFSGKPGKTLKSWADYKKALDSIVAGNPTPSPKVKTLAELDQMREDYRNPIVHPRVVLTEGDSRMLFANGESLIIAMAQEIADVIKTGGVQPALGLVGGKAAGD